MILSCHTDINRKQVRLSTYYAFIFAYYDMLQSSQISSVMLSIMLKWPSYAYKINQTDN